MTYNYLNRVLDDVDMFVANINSGIDSPEVHIDRRWLTSIDHLCYRTETNEDFAEIITGLSKATRQIAMVGEPAMINGRPIATFEFAEPVETGGWNISYLEVPAPKPGSPYREGLEHAEFVVLGGNLAKFEDAHPHLADKFDRDGMDKSINPELGLKIPELDLSVKFHELALGKVVRIEQDL
jgi:predicted metalloenzyme YecM